MAKTTASLKAMAKDTKGKKARAPKQPEKIDAPQKTLSSEFVEETDEESEEGSDSDNETLPKNLVVLTSNAKAPAPAGSSSTSENDSDSEEGSEDGSGAEESEEEEVIAEVVKPTTEVAKTPASAVGASNAPTTYRPPPGFESRSSTDATQVLETFKKSQLAGKQIWYFTAPSSTPISTIKNMSLLSVENGDSVLSHNGNDYGFTRDEAEERSYMTIMVSSSDSSYKAVSKPIDKVLHLGQIVKLPGTDSSGPSKATVPQKKPVRQQPKGLRMRYLPIGFGGEAGILDSSSDSEVEMQKAPKKFKKPVLTNSASSSDNEVEKPFKKSKKIVETSPNSSSNSDLDEDMPDAPILPSIPILPKPTKPSKSVTSAKSTTDGTLKRKHGEDSKKKSKKSSSQLTDTTSNKQLKRKGKADKISKRASGQPVTVP